MENANAFPEDRRIENVNENAGDKPSEIEMEGERISLENDQTDPLVTIGDQSSLYSTQSYKNLKAGKMHPNYFLPCVEPF